MVDRTSLEEANLEVNLEGPSHDGRPAFVTGVDDRSHEMKNNPNPPYSVSTSNKQRQSRPSSTPRPVPEVNRAENQQPQSTLLVSYHEQAAVSVPSSHKPSGSFLGGATMDPVSFSPTRLSDPPINSGGSRPMPHFQKLLANLQNLWPFQTFGNSRGHRMVTESMEHDIHDHDIHDHDHDEETTEDMLGSTVILGKGSPENLKFDWMITDWSRCSQTCGGSGFQMRAAHCMVRLHNTTQDVDNNLCEDAGLPTPPTIQKCGMDDCPRWVPSNWSLCEDSRCFTWNTAMQRRDLECQLINGTEVEAQHCSEAEKPPQRQECYNDKCKGTWKVGEWSECPNVKINRNTAKT